MLRLLKTYGFVGSLRAFRDLVLTALFFRGARIVRFPWYVRGRARMRIGPRFTTGVGLRLDAWGDAPEPCLIIGRDVEVNDHVHIGAIERVQIGDNVLIASRVYISDHDHGVYDRPDPASAPDAPPGKRPVVSRPVVIEDNVWIGEQVCILSGVTIGKGAIVGAGSVVIRDVPPASIVVGNPARCVRRFDAESGEWKRVPPPPR